jgi:hypothetical protein
MILQKQGNTLKSQIAEYVICTRKKATSKKPKHYLLNTTDPEQKKYVSSLYPIAPDQYRFEYQGRYYILTEKEAEAEIVEVSNV